MFFINSKLFAHDVDDEHNENDDNDRGDHQSRPKDMSHYAGRSGKSPHKSFCYDARRAWDKSFNPPSPHQIAGEKQTICSCASNDDSHPAAKNFV